MHLVATEVLDQSEVEKGHRAVVVEQVVARVWIAVERSHAVQAAEHEPEDDLAGAVAVGLWAPQQFSPPETFGQLGGEDASGAELGNDLGNPDERMIAVVVGERLLIAGFAFVVDLFGDTQLDLIDHLGWIESAEALAENGAEQVGILQIGHDRFADTRVLNLDCNSAFDARHGIAQQRSVDLSDRRRCDRIRIELGEDVSDGPTKFALDRLECEVHRHRRGIRLQLGQRETQRFGEPVVEVAGHLAELHQRALHVAEFLCDLLSGSELTMAVEFVSSLGGRERLACRRGRVRGADPGAHPGELTVASQARAMQRAAPSVRRAGAPPPGTHRHDRRDGDGAERD